MHPLKTVKMYQLFPWLCCCLRIFNSCRSSSSDARSELYKEHLAQADQEEGMLDDKGMEGYSLLDQKIMESQGLTYEGKSAKRG